MTGTGMLLLRGLPLRVLGRQMRHGRKGCGRTDKETRRQQETTQAREARCVCLSVLGCVYASVYPSCSRWLLAISSKNDHCCRLYSYKWRVFFFGLGPCPFFFLCCTYVPRVCRVIPCPILLVRASCIACHGSTAQQQSAFTLEYIVPYCRCVRDVPTLKMRVVLIWYVSKTAPSAASMYTAVYSYMCRVFLFWGWDLALYCTYVPRVCRVIPCPILLVRASYHTVFSCDNNSVFITPHSDNISCFGGMYKKKQHHQQA